ncbi:MAG: GNAT family N-acetyltransferase [Xanthomonadaceae bacterium]|nr:GNAT family N-acetyltransferase [Xanthomonadaceae bacterium]
MSLIIRDVRASDLDSVQAINNAAGDGILPLDGARLARLHAIADYFRIAEVDGRVAGFLIAMGHDVDHDSPNFEWFRQRQPAFVYIDRIVIASAARGHGLGRVFYADVQSYAEVRVPLLACEVFLEPRDDVAVLFHGTYGFREVGQQLMPGVGRRVAMLSKDLCSFAFVRDTYLAQGGLPPQPWLAGRTRPATTPQRSAAGGA